MLKVDQPVGIWMEPLENKCDDSWKSWSNDSKWDSCEIYICSWIIQLIYELFDMKISIMTTHIRHEEIEMEDEMIIEVGKKNVLNEIPLKFWILKLWLEWQNEATQKFD